MKNWFIGWITLVTGVSMVQAQLKLRSTLPRSHRLQTSPTLTTAAAAATTTTTTTTLPRPPSPERWLAGCECGGGGGGGGSTVEVMEAKIETSNLCTCIPCGGGYTMTMGCQTCSNCIGRTCFVVTMGEGYYMDGNEDLTAASFFVNVESTGTTSASNNVLAETQFMEMTNDQIVEVTDADNCKVTIDGTVCNSCFGLFSENSSFEIDCSNIVEDYVWNDNDSEEITSDSTHPLYALFVSTGECAQPDNDDDGPVDNDPGQCEPFSSCSNYQDLVDEIYPGLDCSCAECTNGFYINCAVCDGCLDDYCLISREGKEFVADPDIEGKFTETISIIQVTSSGSQSASNEVQAEYHYIDESCHVAINGTLCTSCSDLFEVSNGCFALDCSNVQFGYKWTCNDSDLIKSDTSHPLHGIFWKSTYCELLAGGEPVNEPVSRPTPAPVSFPSPFGDDFVASDFPTDASFGDGPVFDDDTVPSDPQGQCSDTFACSINPMHEYIVDEFYGNYTCSCNGCYTPYDLGIDCNVCNACLNDVCLDFSRSYAWNEQINGDWNQQAVRFHIGTSGTGTANNLVVLEKFFFDSDGNELEETNCRMSIDGTECNSCFAFFTANPDDCYQLDCSNINPDYVWNCDDGVIMILDKSHPMHGFYQLSSTCDSL
ncbi:hypothetical protein FisN_1Lh146 [Fistulifera solaris]|uniref:SMB domain-containing protein n=1 Tax=Fistulifera solaris TaxID=1519565 RepID=A0A1Z5K561_FISSO|nr:hypothetical protein FisN_1Lh146 [Fistulifera solaris]|eukprot:GAX21312.1 hypothetical protein FisN_1Lh146 [Fistulifera solaris]